MTVTAKDLVHNSQLLLQWVLVLDSRQLSADADQMLYLLHTHLTSLLRPATYVEDECCCSGHLCSLSHCMGFAGRLYKGLRIYISFQDSSEVVPFNLYIVPLGDGSHSVEEAGDHALFHIAWVMRGVLCYT